MAAASQGTSQHNPTSSPRNSIASESTEHHARYSASCKPTHAKRPPTPTTRAGAPSTAHRHPRRDLPSASSHICAPQNLFPPLPKSKSNSPWPTNNDHHRYLQACVWTISATCAAAIRAPSQVGADRAGPHTNLQYPSGTLTEKL